MKLTHPTPSPHPPLFESASSDLESQTAPQRLEPRRFSYNSQDPETLDSTVLTLGTRPGAALPETENVRLQNRRALLLHGQLFGLTDDPDYRLDPNPDGDYVYPSDSPSFSAANAFSATAATVETFQKWYGELTGKELEWAFPSKHLTVSPDTGIWPNAFYSRELEGVHFFEVGSTSTGSSGEVAAHEAGHAILDALRPNYLHGMGVETAAFHEAFSDVVALLMSLGCRKTVEAAVRQTDNGDLSSRQNLLSEVGEGFGAALGMEGGIRSSFNSFTWRDPSTLPPTGDEHRLGYQEHDFSRLWSGAFYELLDGISDEHRGAGADPARALMAAGAEGWRLLVGQMEFACRGSETSFKAMAAHLLAGDAEFNGGSRQTLIREVMQRRGLLPGFDSRGATARPQELQRRRAEAAPEPKMFTLGRDFGELAEVRFTAYLEGGASSAEQKEHRDLSLERAREGVKLMLDGDRVLFTQEPPSLAELMREDGSSYLAYVLPEVDGQRVLHRATIAASKLASRERSCGQKLP